MGSTHANDQSADGPGQAAAERVALGRDGGLRVDLCNYGASIMSIAVPTKAGVVPATLAYPALSDYVNDPYYLGVTCGRYAGRIDHGRFQLGQELITLDVGEDDDGHALHGGPQGLHSQYWQQVAADDPDSITFAIRSPAGDQGFPGNLDVRVTYRIEDDMTLAIEYYATSDAATVINLANHAYFNLNGDGGSIDDHVVVIYADRITALRPDGIPNGDIVNVSGTAFDLREPALLGDRLSDLRAENNALAGFDQNYVLNKSANEFALAATVTAARTGLVLDISTTQPGLQFYTSDYLAAPFSPRAGLCLEAQNFPDAPNHPGFPSTRLEPGQVYTQRTVYAFREMEADDSGRSEHAVKGLS